MVIVELLLFSELITSIFWNLFKYFIFTMTKDKWWKLEDFLLNLIHLKFPTVCQYTKLSLPSKEFSKCALLRGGLKIKWNFNDSLCIFFLNPVCYLIWFASLRFIYVLEEKKWTKLYWSNWIPHCSFIEYLAFSLVSFAHSMNLSVSLLRLLVFLVFTSIYKWQQRGTEFLHQKTRLEVLYNTQQILIFYFILII